LLCVDVNIYTLRHRTVLTVEVQLHAFLTPAVLEVTGLFHSMVALITRTGLWFSLDMWLGRFHRQSVSCGRRKNSFLWPVSDLTF